mgnify:CR=1 FL=1
MYNFRRSKLIAQPMQPIVDGNHYLSKGLVGYWPCSVDTATGGTGALKDYSGYGNHGTISNTSITYSTTPGPLNAVGLNFPSIKQFVSFTTPAGLPAYPTGANQLTISFWIKSNSATLRDIVQYNAGTTSGTNLLIQTSSDNIQIDFGSAGHIWGTAASTISQNYMSHVVIVVPPGATLTSDIKIYINGIDVAVSTLSGTAATLNLSAADWLFGERGPSQANKAGQILSEVRLYNRALQSSEVRELYSDPWSGLINPANEILYTFAGVPPTQNIQPTGISSAEAFGSHKINQNINTVGNISSTQAFGTHQLNQKIHNVGAIVSAEAFGTHKLNHVIKPIAITSQEVFGIPKLHLVIYTTGPPILSAETFGTHKLNQKIHLVGNIASVEAFGSHKLNQRISPTSITTLEAFGSHKLNLKIHNAGNIASAEAFGTPTIVPGTAYVLPSGIISQEAFGLHELDLEIEEPGVPSAEAFGLHQINQKIKPSSIDSLEAFGSHKVNLNIHVIGITSDLSLIHI